jgi:hypothetical protein
MTVSGALPTLGIPVDEFYLQHLEQVHLLHVLLLSCESQQHRQRDYAEGHGQQQQGEQYALSELMQAGH